MFKFTIHNFLTAFVMAFIAITFTSLASAQRYDTTLASTAETVDTPIYPHDFSDKFYDSNGVNFKLISGRLTGTDLLSVFSKTQHPSFSPVRVLITVPAYSQTGEHLFFSPLGKIMSDGFLNTRAGIEMREAAMRNPIFVFPQAGVRSNSLFGAMRQAPVIDQSFETYAREKNPLGLRLIRIVEYTEKAFTAEGARILSQFIIANGTAADGGPILRAVNEIIFLEKYGLITIRTETKGGTYAIAPIIRNVETGGIAEDAFLAMATRDGRILEAERIFVAKFECAKKGSCQP